MVSKGTVRRLLAGTLVVGIGGLAAGCQSKDALSGAAAAPKEKITQSELLAFCPPIGLRQGTAFFTSYENAAPARPARRAAAAADAPPAEDALAEKPAQRVVYQTSITDVTRSCKRGNGTLTMTVAVAGKVVPGPAARPGSVQLPLRIAVTGPDGVLFTQLYRHSVQVENTATATQYLFTATDVSFPDPSTRAVRGFAGFDEGPPKGGGSGSDDLPPD